MKSPLTRVLLVLIAALMLLPMVGCEDRFTQDNFDKIKDGMQLYEVETIMGGKGEAKDYQGTDISAAGIGSSSHHATQQIYQWDQGTKIVTVTVVDGKVIAHNKSGF